uniref:Antimicrobial peptide cecropin n=1 Tax=Plutella xylostella TaxID=51655 RepID=A6BMG0_PLUXY|nr:antimicrobial peptide cecropin [Plutella xylostella]BAF64473.1 cecropin A [Plutella xylostella]
MKLSNIFFFVFMAFFAVASVSAAPRWKPFKKLEKVGRNIRNGIIRYNGPAVAVIGQATSIARPTGK